MAKKSDLATKSEQFSKEEVEDEEEVEEEEEDDESEDDDDESEDDGDEEEQVDEEEEQEDDDLSSRESILQLLEPFGKDQLIDLLKEAAAKDPSLLSRISGTPAPVDPSQRKIFVHGLASDATTADLTAAFSQYGEIEDCRAVTDRLTNRCKGYGFVLFRTLSAVRKALKEPQKKIGNRMTSSQLASLGPPPTHQQPVQGMATAGLGLLPMGLMGQGPSQQVGLVGQGMNLPSGLIGGQTAGFSPSLASSGRTPSSYGVGGGSAGVNSVSQSVIGRYGSLEALQGLGSRSTYSSSTDAWRSQQSGYGSSCAGLPPYMGRYQNKMLFPAEQAFLQPPILLHKAVSPVSL